MTPLQIADHRINYLVAYARANPKKPFRDYPHLSYENGWWCFRNGDQTVPSHPMRYRHAELLAMIERLNSAAAEPPIDLDYIAARR